MFASSSKLVSKLTTWHLTPIQVSSALCCIWHGLCNAFRKLVPSSCRKSDCCSAAVNEYGVSRLPLPAPSRECAWNCQPELLPSALRGFTNATHLLPSQIRQKIREKSTMSSHSTTSCGHNSDPCWQCLQPLELIKSEPERPCLTLLSWFHHGESVSEYHNHYMYCHFCGFTMNLPSYQQAIIPTSKESDHISQRFPNIQIAEQKIDKHNVSGLLQDPGLPNYVISPEPKGDVRSCGDYTSPTALPIPGKDYITVCLSCQLALFSNWRFCPYCGNYVDKSVTVPIEWKKLETYIWLCQDTTWLLHMSFACCFFRMHVYICFQVVRFVMYNIKSLNVTKRRILI